jgi:hypothetical protein
VVKIITDLSKDEKLEGVLVLTSRCVEWPERAIASAGLRTKPDRNKLKVQNLCKLSRKEEKNCGAPS